MIKDRDACSGSRAVPFATSRDPGCWTIRRMNANSGQSSPLLSLSLSRPRKDVGNSRHICTYTVQVERAYRAAVDSQSRVAFLRSLKMSGAQFPSSHSRKNNKINETISAIESGFICNDNAPTSKYRDRDKRSAAVRECICRCDNVLRQTESLKSNNSHFPPQSILMHNFHGKNGE